MSPPQADGSLPDCIAAAAAAIRTRMPAVPEVGIVLGSGLGAFADELDGVTRLPYSDIPHFHVPHVEGHAGELVMGQCRGVPCAVLNGRVHYYEGHAMAQVTFAVRVLQAIGIKRLIVTNSAGGLNADYAPGDLMVIEDHLNWTGQNPLIGPHDARLGVRFLDMTAAYSPAGRKAWHAAAGALGLKLRQGIYLGLTGPSYETPAEVRMLQRMGGDAVGMSTVAEVIIARHCGLEVAGLSVISNRAAGLSDAPLSHHEVTEVASQVRPQLCQLLAGMVSTWR
jgi:purine-nucleoside phosphorylase